MLNLYLQDNLNPLTTYTVRHALSTQVRRGIEMFVRCHEAGLGNAAEVWVSNIREANDAMIDLGMGE